MSHSIGLAFSYVPARFRPLALDIFLLLLGDIYLLALRRNRSLGRLFLLGIDTDLVGGGLWSCWQEYLVSVHHAVVALVRS